MLYQCFNPECRKPLHYLREGRVFVFGVHECGDGDHEEGSRLEHYWLCGSCAQRFVMAQREGGIQMVKRTKRLSERIELDLPEPPQALAS